MPEALAITHDGRNLYAGGANSEAGLIVLARDTATGALAPGGCLRGDKDLCSYPGGSGPNEPLAMEVTPDRGCRVDVRS
jgi:hypothetical protein